MNRRLATLLLLVAAAQACSGTVYVVTRESSGEAPAAPTGMVGGGQGGQGGGGGCLDMTDPQAFFEICLARRMSTSCGRAGCHDSGEYGFLQVPAYASITTYKTKVYSGAGPCKQVFLRTKDPLDSPLLIYTDAPDHDGGPWAEVADDGLQAEVLHWLELEAVGLAEPGPPC